MQRLSLAGKLAQISANGARHSAAGNWRLAEGAGRHKGAGLDLVRGRDGALDDAGRGAGQHGGAKREVGAVQLLVLVLLQRAEEGRDVREGKRRWGDDGSDGDSVVLLRAWVLLGSLSGRHLTTQNPKWKTVLERKGGVVYAWTVYLRMMPWLKACCYNTQHSRNQGCHLAYDCIE